VGKNLPTYGKPLNSRVGKNLPTYGKPLYDNNLAEKSFLWLCQQKFLMRIIDNKGENLYSHKAVIFYCKYLSRSIGSDRGVSGSRDGHRPPGK